MGQYVQVTNNSRFNAILIGGRLLSNGKSIAASLPGHGEAKWRTVAPGDSSNIYCVFDFLDAGGDAEAVLAPTISWQWDFQLGEEERTLELEMVRK
jgi:hypothetical protein